MKSEIIATIDQLCAENEQLRAEVEETEAANDRLTTAINEIESEYQRLRAALRQIGQGIDPHADQLQNWIAGIVDTALGEVTQ